MIFTGEVTKVVPNGERLSARCTDVVGTLMQRRYPHILVELTCNYQIYSRSCGVNKNDHKYSCTVLSQAPLIVLSTQAIGQLGNGYGYFAGGWLEAGSGNTFQIRPILNSHYEGSTALELDIPQQLIGIPDGEPLTIYPGCDGQASTCTQRYNNYINFGGFPDVPEVNPFVKAVETGTRSSNVGKK